MTSKIFKFYIGFGTLYGFGRSYYWLNRLNDCTLTDEGVKYHTPTIQTKILYTVTQIGISHIGCPIFLLDDLSIYEKSKLNIKSKNPPYPFDNLSYQKK